MKICNHKILQSVKINLIEETRLPISVKNFQMSTVLKSYTTSEMDF